MMPARSGCHARLYSRDGPLKKPCRMTAHPGADQGVAHAVVGVAETGVPLTATVVIGVAATVVTRATAGKLHRQNCR